MNTHRWNRAALSAALLLAGLGFSGCDRPLPSAAVQDEARVAGRGPETFPAADENYFRDMDGGVELSAAEVKGRNSWLVWTGGNDRFWDQLSHISVGTVDFLKTVSSHPALPAKRADRWEQLGLVNEPCFTQASGPDTERHGLWLDKRGSDCAPDPFADTKKYPGVTLGARGKNVPVGSYYGEPSGVLGLRLFPNPAFDEAAAKKWDSKRYYEDASYYESKDLIRPYRVGMSCAFCHVGPNPVNPPADAENPKWENLSSGVGAQYFWVDRIFVWKRDESSFPYQIFHTSRPGALDTSFISTDNINNPRTMNALYLLGARLEQARQTGKEKLAGGELDNKQFHQFAQTKPFGDLFQAPDTVFTPRVLKDGSDSVGALGALNRVYLNIGLYSEDWLLHFNALVGGKRITPIQVANAQKNSTYWQATEQQTPDMALFFLKSTDAHKLKDAPGGAAHLSQDADQLAQGKKVFGENCAKCHSSKLPTPLVGLTGNGCAGPNYLACFKDYWKWTKTDEFKKRMVEIVQADNFLDQNYLSTELRVPVTLLQTNACSPLATNALRGNIWDNFSSQSYKALPSVGTITVHHPITGEPRQYQMPAGGRGYTRPPSLVSLWSTAPFLLNNTVGRFESSPSVEARLRSFDDSIEKMLWPEKREKDPVFGDRNEPGMGLIDRTSAQSYLRVPTGYLPEALQDGRGVLERFLPWLYGGEGIEIGPIPKGTPINLLANLNPLSESMAPAERVTHASKVLGFVKKAKNDLKQLPKGASNEEARKVFANLVPSLLELNKCPDFVVNRGHYFGTNLYNEPADWSDTPRTEPAKGLSDQDKRALIAFLKTF